MLYKSSDGDKKPNLSVLAELVNQHGSGSPEVQAFLDLYQEDEQFMRQAQSVLQRRGETEDE